MIKKYFIFILFNINFILFPNELLWEKALPGKIINIPIERVNGDIVFICEDRRIYSINRLTGEINWKTKLGGRLSNILISNDGSIIVSEKYALYSLFSNGDIRWVLNFPNGITGNISSNNKGDIFLITDNAIKKIGRSGIITEIANSLDSDKLVTLDNYLIVHCNNYEVTALTLGGKIAWKLPVRNNIYSIKSKNNNLYIIYDSGTVEKYDLNGKYVNKWDTDSIITNAYFNFKDQLVTVSGSKVYIMDENTLINKNLTSNGLYYSNSFILETKSDWTLSAFLADNDNIFYPSGKKQIISSTITLYNKNIWNNKLSEYYTNLILYGKRDEILKITNKLKNEINNSTFLDDNPYFYDFLLLAISSLNSKDDIKQEAYRIIGLSKDISFQPYIVANLKNENSYNMLTYIFYALGQLGVDLNGGVIKLINSKIEHYYDEALALNALYALYYINKYTNNEFLDSVFVGIEKILSMGYSKYIEDQCYDIIKKLK